MARKESVTLCQGPEYTRALKILSRLPYAIVESQARSVHALMLCKLYKPAYDICLMSYDEYSDFIVNHIYG